MRAQRSSRGCVQCSMLRAAFTHSHCTLCAAPTCRSRVACGRHDPAHAPIHVPETRTRTHFRTRARLRARPVASPLRVREQSRARSRNALLNARLRAARPVRLHEHGTHIHRIRHRHRAHLPGAQGQAQRPGHPGTQPHPLVQPCLSARKRALKLAKRRRFPPSLSTRKWALRLGKNSPAPPRLSARKRALRLR